MRKAMFVLFVGVAAIVGGVAVAQDHGDKRGGMHKVGPQEVRVTYLAGNTDRTLDTTDVTGFDVEDMKGGKFLVLTTSKHKRVYFAYDKVLAIVCEPLGDAPPVAPK